MEKTDLTTFDKKPREMINYLRYNGPHFNKRLAMFAISKMKKDGEQLEPVQQENLDEMLEEYNIHISEGQLSDALYVVNMAKADYWESSITDEEHLAKYVKDYIDDEDGYDGIAFNRFIADCARKGIVIPWADMV